MDTCSTCWIFCIGNHTQYNITVHVVISTEILQNYRVIADFCSITWNARSLMGRYQQLRARRVLIVIQIKYVPLRTRRALSLYKVYGDRASGSQQNIIDSVNILLALSWWYNIFLKYSLHYRATFRRVAGRRALALSWCVYNILLKYNEEIYFLQHSKYFQPIYTLQGHITKKKAA